MIIFYGLKASKLGEFDIEGTKCPYCKQEEPQHVSVFGRYAHLFWIPLFPLGKKKVAECTHCKKTYSLSAFSPQLKAKYKKHKNSIKRPLWHWFGISLIAGILLIAGITLGFSHSEPDPRSDLLVSDIAKMTQNPSFESDSLSYKLKGIFNEIIVPELKPEKFKYYSAINGNKLLVLVTIQSLKKVDKKVRKEIIEYIETIINSQEGLKDMEKYIGIHGKYNMMMLKTPTIEKSGNFIFEFPLFDFYGPKPEPKEKQ